MAEPMEDVRKVDLFPERRQRQSSQTDTLKYFTPSQRTTQSHEVESEGEGQIRKQRQKQGVLSFTNGRLTTKKPLTNPTPRDDAGRKSLAEVAQETWTLLPGLLATRPDVTNDSFMCRKESLDPSRCPQLQSATVRVLDMDSIDAALMLQSNNNSGRPIAILNMANAQHAGGGWQHGAMAQEEAICYRTSLAKTLHRKHYAIPFDAALYSPTVMVIRDSLKNGHDLLDFRDPRQLEVISVISCAAVCQPAVGKYTNGKFYYQDQSDVKLMREKMRVILRTAIRNRHKQVVLGAFGCGAFANPNDVIAKMWKDVFLETEFQGGYWKDIVFAVLDGRRDDNFQVFYDELDGLSV